MNIYDKFLTRQLKTKTGFKFGYKPYIYFTILSTSNYGIKCNTLCQLNSKSMSRMKQCVDLNDANVNDFKYDAYDTNTVTRKGHSNIYIEQNFDIF